MHFAVRYPKDRNHENHKDYDDIDMLSTQPTNAFDEEAIEHETN